MILPNSFGILDSRKSPNTGGKMRIFLTLIVLYASACVNPKVHPPANHPEVVKLSAKRIEASDQRMSFSFLAQLSKTPYRVVAIICRPVRHRMTVDDKIHDQVVLYKREGGVQLVVTPTTQYTYTLKDNPMVVYLYHRDKQLRRKYLAAWIVNDREIRALKTPYQTGYPYLVQTTEAHIGIARR